MRQGLAYPSGLSFNRTSMELKLAKPHRIAPNGFAFNRTSMELKLGRVEGL